MTKEKDSELIPLSFEYNDYGWGASLLKAASNYLKKAWFNEVENEFEHIQRIRVIFDENISSEEFENDFGNKTVTIYAPKLENESLEKQEERHRNLLRFYGAGIQEAHLGLTAKFLSLLTNDAKENLLRDYILKKDWK